MITNPQPLKKYRLRFENGAELIVRYAEFREGLYRFIYNNDEYGLLTLDAVSEITQPEDKFYIVINGERREATIRSCRVVSGTRISIDAEISK